ncbi:MAG: 5-formyltetrahydrofolate cyclo-ligase [Blastopirellula sp. JB062]
MFEAAEEKRRLRKKLLAARQAIPDRAERSAKIAARLSAWRSLNSADTLLCYVSARSEVDTRQILNSLLTSGRRVVVPYCRDEERLGLFLLTCFSQLTPGRFGILEPIAERRASQSIAAAEIDFAILPGAAFDLQGNRLGYGKGYFDRLLRDMSPKLGTCALAFEPQIVPNVPTQTHDLPIDYLVSENRWIDCAAQRSCET